MRILLDENTPPTLASFLGKHTVSHVDHLGLKSLSNGELLTYAREEFDCFVTLDKGIMHQHQHEGHALIIIVIRVPDSRKATVLARGCKLAQIISTLKAGDILELV